MAEVNITSSRSDSAKDLLATATTTLKAMPAALASAAAEAARTGILDATVAARGTLSVSGLGAVLDAVVEPPVASTTSATAAIRGTPAGPWTIVEDGARAHEQRRRRGMPTPYGVFSRVEHPGTLGIAVWAGTAGPDAADEAAQSAVDSLPSG